MHCTHAAAGPCSRTPNPPPNTRCPRAPTASHPHHPPHGHSLSVTSNYSHTSRLQPRAPRPSFDEALPSPTLTDEAAAAAAVENDGDHPALQLDGDAAPARRAPSETSRPTTPAVSLKARERHEDSP